MRKEKAPHLGIQLAYEKENERLKTEISNLQGRLAVATQTMGEAVDKARLRGDKIRCLEKEISNLRGKLKEVEGKVLDLKVAVGKLEKAMRAAKAEGAPNG